jgi:hypothetical protein
MIRNIIISVIILAVPIYFVTLFLMSGYHSLSKLRRRCGAARSQEDYEQAASAYHAERKRFPSIFAAVIFRFKPAPPFKAGVVGPSGAGGSGPANRT